MSGITSRCRGRLAASELPVHRPSEQRSLVLQELAITSAFGTKRQTCVRPTSAP